MKIKCSIILYSILLVVGIKGAEDSLTVLDILNKPRKEIPGYVKGLSLDRAQAFLTELEQPEYLAHQNGPLLIAKLNAQLRSSFQPAAVQVVMIPEGQKDILKETLAQADKRIAQELAAEKAGEALVQAGAAIAAVEDDAEELAAAIAMSMAETPTQSKEREKTEAVKKYEAERDAMRSNLNKEFETMLGLALEYPDIASDHFANKALQSAYNKAKENYLRLSPVYEGHYRFYPDKCSERMRFLSRVLTKLSEVKRKPVCLMYENNAPLLKSCVAHNAEKLNLLGSFGQSCDARYSNTDRILKDTLARKLDQKCLGYKTVPFDADRFAALENALVQDYIFQDESMYVEYPGIGPKYVATNLALESCTIDELFFLRKHEVLIRKDEIDAIILPRLKEVEEEIVEPDRTCPICVDDLFNGSCEDLNTARCGHRFHKPCLIKWRTSGQQLSNFCPLCRERL